MLAWNMLKLRRCQRYYFGSQMISNTENKFLNGILYKLLCKKLLGLNNKFTFIKSKMTGF
jgi:hypothetical protein